MRTIVLKALENATGIFPKVGYNSIRIIKRTDLTPSFNIMSLASSGSTNISIEGGVFIEGGVEKTSVSVSTVVKSVSVKVLGDFAYMHIPHGFFLYLRQDWANTSVDAPYIDYSTVRLPLTSLNGMFNSATSFNQDINNLDVSLVGNFDSAFTNARAFNRPLNKWNTASATTMSNMFSNAISFNQDISSWNVSSVISMSSMFNNATSFNQDISSWNFNKEVNLNNFMSGKSNYNPTYYDNLLIKLDSIDWSGRVANKVLGMGTNKYTSAGESARASLVSKGWTITDGGLV